MNVAITPPSDIVLDVARAADPDRYRAAVERLARLRATADASAPQATGFNVAPPPSAPRLEAGAGAGAQPRRRLDAYGQFEAFVLQSFLQSMLPHNATNVYGRGSAGEFWRSMLAEKMGEELARSGQVGIARGLAASSNRPAQTGANPTESSLTLSPPLLGSLIHVQPQVPIAGQADGAEAPATPAAVERS